MPAHRTPAKGLPGPAMGLGKALCLLAQRRKSFPVLGPFGADAILLFIQRHSVPEWPENCRVIAVFPSHLPPMLPSNKFYSPYVDRLYTPRENTWQSMNPSLLELEGIGGAKVIFVVLVSISGVLPWSRGS